MSKKPLCLCILDGFGNGKADSGNAIVAAKTPNIDRLFAENPTTAIGASGMDVGLPDGQMGNSEVGHTNIGAGRIVYQELTRITKAVQDGDFFENPALVGAIENCKKNGSALHLIGLTSDGGVHSHNTHLYALVELAKRHGLDRVFCHALLDGRDVPPASGADFVAQLRDKLAEIGVGQIATTMGRYYAMDRDNRWERVNKAYAAMVYGEGTFNPDPVDAIRKSYETIDEEGKHLTDEFVLPVVCVKDAGIRENDSVIFFNFRPDRAREITRTFVDPDFNGFERKNGFFPLYYVCMTQYDATMPNVNIA
ncbi:MAG: 2,3-bisphosphoglycerate-independent phosphoglycerate mutase, partial [Ruminococcaceae bacterium]|nr:2,3-bisphosphoglycerate-independent phosphoglycerate mutase [Oscillospiraceae bacterium]